jgi:hypothetical protein
MAHKSNFFSVSDHHVSLKRSKVRETFAVAVDQSESKLYRGLQDCMKISYPQQKISKVTL